MDPLEVAEEPLTKEREQSIAHRGAGDAIDAPAPTWIGWAVHDGDEAKELQEAQVVPLGRERQDLFRVPVAANLFPLVRNPHAEVQGLPVVLRDCG